MAKRGEKRPWKVICQWPGGTPWTESYSTEARANDRAREQRAIVGHQSGEANCDVRVDYQP